MFTSENNESLEVKKEEIQILSDDISLPGTIFYPAHLKEKNPAILFVHGFGSSQDSSFPAAEAVTKEDFISLTFTMRGHGADSSKPNEHSRQEFLNDILAAYDYLVSRDDVELSQITVVGASLGGYLAALLSNERQLRGCVLRAPADYIDDNFDKPGIRGSEFTDVMEWRKQNHLADETKALLALHNFKGEVLIVESGKDDTIPPQTIQNYCEAIPDKNHLTYRLMPEAGHSIKKDGEATEEYIRIIREWLNDKIKSNE